MNFKNNNKYSIATPHKTLFNMNNKLLAILGIKSVLCQKFFVHWILNIKWIY